MRGQAGETRVLATLRRLLLATLAIGAVGTAAELLLLEHYESALQYAPLVLLAVGIAAIGWHAATSSARSVVALQVVMVLFLASGALGVALHFKGNVEFELELHPGVTGGELVLNTLMGATPVLAPGSMALLGLIGLAYTYRHPAAYSQ